VTRRYAPLACLLALAVPMSACGSGEIDDPELERKLGDIRQATEKYKDRRLARRDGYVPTPACTASADDEGAMGIAFVNRALSRDDKVDILRPEQLLYEPGPKRRRTLVGVMYAVPSTGQRPPDTPLGHLDGPIPGRFKGQGDNFAVAAWVHRSNPNGVFDTFNPNVNC
jgi:hypothetical protein